MVVQPTCVDGAKTESAGHRLRVLREQRGIQRERLALALGMGSENLRHYEAGRQGLTLRMLPRIAEVFGMSARELAAHLLGEDSESERPA